MFLTLRPKAAKVEKSQLIGEKEIEVISNSELDDLSFLPRDLEKLILNIKGQKKILLNFEEFTNLKYLKIINGDYSILDLKIEAPLQTLICTKNNLKELTLALSDCHSLEVLDLGHNQLKQALSKDFYAPNLLRLTLDNNLIENIPGWALGLDKLKHLSVDKNPLGESSKEIIREEYAIEV